MSVEYEVDLQTKRGQLEVERMWEQILTTLKTKMESTPPEQRDERINGWCDDLAAGMGLHFYRRDNWLQFCDKELAPS